MRLPRNAGFLSWFAWVCVLGVFISGSTEAANTYVVSWDGTKTNVAPYSPVPQGLTNVVEVAVGLDHIVALHDDGRVTAWGANTFGQTNVPPDLTNVIAVAAGNGHTLALLRDGTVRAWGDNRFGQTDVPVGVTSATAVNAFLTSSVAVLRDGRLVMWGGLRSWEATGVSNVCVFSGGLGYTLAVTTTGRPLAWTAPSWGSVNPSLWEQSNIVSAASGHSDAALLLPDGSIWSGHNSLGPRLWTHPSGFVQVCGSGSQMLGVGRDGSVFTWSDPWQNRTNLPLGLTNVVYASGQSQFAAILSADGGPLFTVHPASRSAYVGSRTRFECLAAGRRPLGYQWEKDGILLTGQTNASLTVDAVLPEHDGIYRVRIWNDHGEVVSRPAGLAVLNAAPLIVQQPLSTNMWLSGEASLLVSAVGTLPQEFIWHSNGVPVLWELQGSLRLPNLRFSDTADYYVVVTNALGRATSSVARVSVVNVISKRNGVMQDVLPNLTNVVQFVQAEAHSVALIEDGTVRVWGAPATATNVPPGLTNIIQVAAGGFHTLALRADGTVISWGTNYYLNSGYIAHDVPADVSNVVAIACADDSNMAVRSDGSLVMWGYVPVLDAGVSAKLKKRITGISAAFGRFMALHFDGTVTCWDSTGKERSTPPVVKDVVAVSTSTSRSAALLRDGKVVVWSSATSFTVPHNLTNVVAIATTDYFTLGLQTDGRIAGFPHTTSDAPKLLPEDLPPALSIGGKGALAVLATKQVQIPWHARAVSVVSGCDTRLFIPVVSQAALNLQWFYEGEPIPGATSRILELLEVSRGGSYRLVAETTTGEQAVADVQVNVVDGPPIVRSETADRIGWLRNEAVLVCEASGSLPMTYQWRFNGSPLPTATNDVLHLNNLQYSDAGTYQLTASNAFGTVTFSEMPLRVDSVCGWGRTAATNIPPGLSNIVALSTDRGVCVALRADGHVTAWGDPANYWPGTPWWNGLSMEGLVAFPVSMKAGVGLMTNGYVTGMPFSPNKALAVATGRSHSLALLPGGKVFAWGDNSVGQLNVPAELQDVIAISARADHSLALRKNGTVVAWGSDSNGESTVPPGLSNVVAISAGYNNSLAVTSAGELVGWGNNFCGQSELTNHSGNLVTASAGETVTAAMLSDGRILSWGCNIQVPIPQRLTTAAVVVSGGYDVFALIKDQPETAVRIMDARVLGDDLEFSFPTELSRSYIVERSLDLSRTGWQVASGVAGDGSIQTIRIPIGPAPTSFYRLRRN